MKIFFSPHSSRHKEACFVDFLRAQYPQAEIVKENFVIPEERLGCLVDTRQLISWLEDDNLLPSAKRLHAIRVLRDDCPSQIRVTKRSSRISVDVVIVKDEVPHYWEFHEKQHRRLTISKPKEIYASDGTAIPVPRFVQRFVRDIWRVLYLKPMTIVWDDWFERNHAKQELVLSQDFREYHLDGKFSFRTFCQMDGPQF